MCEKCGFPLAEERKRKTFFSHMAGSLGTGLRGFSGHVARVKFQFLFCHPPLPDMPHPPTHEVLAECVQLKCTYCLATFLCHCKTIMFLLIKVRLCGSLAWLPAVCEK